MLTALARGLGAQISRSKSQCAVFGRSTLQTRVVDPLMLSQKGERAKMQNDGPGTVGSPVSWFLSPKCGRRFKLTRRFFGTCLHCSKIAQDFKILQTNRTVEALS